MTFLDDFEDGFSMPFRWGYNKLEKIDKLGDRAIGAAGNVADGLGNLFQGNTLLYLAIGVVAVVVLPKVLDKVL